MSSKPKYINVEYKNNDNNLSLKIKHILNQEDFCVLASVSENQCHTSLISFVASEDLSKIVFATPIKTKKYNYIKDNTAVSLLFDNRSKGISNINDLVALNVIGNAKILKDSQDIDLWSKLLIEKHQYLKDFIMANTSALILIEVEKYSYVTSFQKVSELNIK